MRLNTIIYEEFYKDPAAVRSEVLQQDFYPANYLDDIVRAEGLDNDLVFHLSQIGNFCGKRTINAKENLVHLHTYTLDIVKQICNFQFPIEINSFFSLHTEEDINKNNSIHQDKDPIMAGIVYLSPIPIIGSGTYFYQHKKSKWTGLNYDKCPQSAFPDMYPNKREDQNINNFQEFGYVENMWNRLVLYDTNAIHKPGKMFGTDKNTGRLTQTFFVYMLRK